MTFYESYKYSEQESLLRGARWADEEEIKRVTRKIRLSDPKCVIHGGFPVISDGDTVYLDDSDAHTLIIGSTGSKKTRLFAMPMLEIIRRAGESAVVTDPKGELYDLSAQAFENSGYRVYVINLREPMKSDGWNPFAQARYYWKTGNSERASMIVNDFAATMIPIAQNSKKDPFWDQTSRALLQGLTMMLVEGIDFFPDETVNLATLRYLSDHLEQQDENHIPTGFSRLLDQYPQDSLAISNIRVGLQGSEKTFDNIRVSYEASVQHLYIQKSLVSMLSRQDVDFSRLGSEKTILYLIMPDEKTTLHAIVSLIIKQCYEQLIDQAQRYEENTLPQRVNFLLDEFSNLPPIPDMPAMISAARSRNIKFFLIIQGLHQLSSKYGIDDAQTIKGNCTNWAFLTSRELPLLNEISELCGQDATTGEKLITATQLQRLNKEKGEALILLGRQYPYITHLADISEYHLPVLPRRPFPEIAEKDVPVRRIFDEDPEDDFSMHSWENIPSLEELFAAEEPSQEKKPDEEADLQKQLDKRFDELFGKQKKRRKK